MQLAVREKRLEDMFARVRGAGLKLTPQRMAIVQELAQDPTHPTAQELFERLRRSMPTMSFATVYNTLGALAEAGLCASLSLSPGPARFDANMEPHDHAVCDKCGNVRDVPCEPLAETNPTKTALEGPCMAGFSLRTVERIFRGVCAACAAKEAHEELRAAQDKP